MEDLSKKPIVDFLKEMAKKGNLETKFCLAKAINVFAHQDLKTVDDVLHFDDRKPSHIMSLLGGPVYTKYNIYMGVGKYGWKTHDFVRNCFKVAGISEEKFGRFLSKSSGIK